MQAPRRTVRRDPRSATVSDLLYALLLIGGFALLVLTMRGLERL
jgi:hypothetical protein